MITPSLYACQVAHTRTAPLRHGFRYRTYLWLVDLDHLPRLPWYLRPWAGFRAADHLGDPAASLRSNVDSYLAEHDIDLHGGPIVMLTQARVFGYVFNPITVYWCHNARPRQGEPGSENPRPRQGEPGSEDRAGAPVCVVVEVHNTYGGRHRYLLHPDERDRASTAKEFYVSPFFPVDGEYRMRLPEPAAELALSITLHRDGGTPFGASLRGQRRALTARTLLRAAVAHPWSTAVVSLRIRRQGIHLFLRGLPVQPRPTGGCPVTTPESRVRGSV